MPTLDDVLNDVDAIGAEWYTILTNRPAVVASTSPELIDLQQRAGVIPAPATPIGVGATGPDLLPIVLGFVAALMLALILKE